MRRGTNLCCERLIMSCLWIELFERRGCRSNECVCIHSFSRYSWLTFVATWCVEWLVLMGNCRVSAVMISRLMLNLRDFYGAPPTQRESRGNESFAFADVSGAAIDETMSVAWIFSSMWIIWLRCQFTRWLCLMAQTTMVPSNRLYNMMGHSQIYRFAPDMAPTYPEQ